MSTPQWIYFAVYLAALGSGLVYMLRMLNLLGDAYIDFRLRKRLRNDLIGAIGTSQPLWPQVVQIAQSRGLGQRDSFVVVRSMLRDALIGAEPGLLPHRQLLEGYIEAYKRAEPYEGLPSSTRVPLERLHDELAARATLLEPLTQQIRELVSIHEKENARQRLLTTWGFGIGVLGLLFAAYAYFFPYNPESTAATAPPASSNPASAPPR